jgi:hypothetical protein
LRLPVSWVSSAKQKTTQSSNLSNFFLYFQTLRVISPDKKFQIFLFTGQRKAKWDYPSALKLSDIFNVELFSLKSPASVLWGLVR